MLVVLLCKPADMGNLNLSFHTKSHKVVICRSLFLELCVDIMLHYAPYCVGGVKHGMKALGENRGCFLPAAQSNLLINSIRL